MGFKLNLNNDEIKAAQSTGFAALPEGIYGAVIYTCVQKQSKGGNEMFEIDFKITDGPEGIGRKQRGWFVLAPQALFAVVGLNKAVGFPVPSKDTVTDGAFEFAEAEDYVGLKVNVKLDQTPYESVDEEGNDVTKLQNNVKRVTKYDPDKIAGAEATDTKSGLFL